MRHKLKTILLDYDEGDDITGAIMAYGLDGRKLVELGVASYDRDANVYRRTFRKKEE
jgi:hypothetical protein